MRSTLNRHAHQVSEDLPMLAADALARGVDSPMLREAAGASLREIRDARELFVAALNELGIEIPDANEAMWKLVRHVASEIVSGATTPFQGASWIWRRARNRVEREGDLRVFVGLASEWEDHPDHRVEIDERIIVEARMLLQRPQLRPWVLVKAEPRSWPLRDPRSRRCLDQNDLPISKSLVEDLTRWANDFDATIGAGNRGPSGFKSRTDAQDFATRGAQLVGRLQTELGDQWHVEYMPTQTAFPSKPGRSRPPDGKS